jgi:hypothetical protein
MGTAVVLGTTGALALPAVASVHSPTHTLKFISVTKQSIPLTKKSGAEQDTDVNAAGKTIGRPLAGCAARFRLVSSAPPVTAGNHCVYLAATFGRKYTQ